MSVFNNIKNHIGKELLHVRISRLEQLKYELESEVSGLEKSKSEHPTNQLINEMFEIKKRQLDNVSARLANLRRKNDL